MRQTDVIARYLIDKRATFEDVVALGGIKQLVSGWIKLFV